MQHKFLSILIMVNIIRACMLQRTILHTFAKGLLSSSHKALELSQRSVSEASCHTGTASERATNARKAAAAAGTRLLKPKKCLPTNTA